MLAKEVLVPEFAKFREWYWTYALVFCRKNSDGDNPLDMLLLSFEQSRPPLAPGLPNEGAIDH
jgi:hypothetical protein